VLSCAVPRRAVLCCAGLVFSCLVLWVQGKRVTSSMAPTIVLYPDGSPFFAVGLPGGIRIFTSVLQAVINVIDHKMTPQQAVSRQLQQAGSRQPRRGTTYLVVPSSPSSTSADRHSLLLLLLLLT
jgi:hypothetical protein